MASVGVILLSILAGFVGLYILLLIFIQIVSKRPTNIGVKDGKLAECPDIPNCYSTDTSIEHLKVDFIPLIQDVSYSKRIMKEVIAGMSRTKLIKETNDYLYFEFRSLAWRFIDDVELYFNESTKNIHIRSASRIGTNDYGMNPKRIEEIRDGFEKATTNQ